MEALTKPDGMFVAAKDINNLICIKFQNNILTIYNWNNQFNPLAQINLLQQKVTNEDRNINQNFNANINNFQRNVLNNFNFNQQNFQQQLSNAENNVLNNIRQFYSNQDLVYKYQTVCNYYIGDIQKMDEILSFCGLNEQNYVALNNFYNKKYAEYLIRQCNVNDWEQLVSKI